MTKPKELKFTRTADYLSLNFKRKDGGPKIIQKDDVFFEIATFLIENNPWEILINFVKSIPRFSELTYKNKMRFLSKYFGRVETKNDVIRSFHILKDMVKILKDVSPKKYILQNILAEISATNKSEHIGKIYKNTLYDYLLYLTNKTPVIDKFFKGTPVKVKNGILYFKNIQLKETRLVKDIIKSIYIDGTNPMHYVNFLCNVMKNRNKYMLEQLYDFLEAGNMKITKDGMISAYKKITKDWKDIYTGRIDHSIGSKPRMKWEDVDCNREQTCSSGLHFCGFKYLNTYGRCHNYRIVEVLINPKDVAAIPQDYNNLKGRCVGYTVLREVTGMGDCLANKPLYNALFTDSKIGD